MVSSITPAVEPAARLDLTSGGPGDVLGPMALDIELGETVALTGPSGVGKTTLLRVLAGLETRFKGHRSAPQRIAVVFQEPVLLPWRGARDNLVIVAGMTASQADDWLSNVGLAGLGDRYPNQLSLGQQRRLSLARAFAMNADLLLMDEPFVSLDADVANEMMALFERLRAVRPTTALIVTHAETEAQRLAGRILRMEGHPARLRAG